MFNDFKVSQYNSYNLLLNSVKNNKVSHAYLIDCNSFDLSREFVMSFVKMLFCVNNYAKKDKLCESCNLCNRIDNNNYTEFKQIFPEGSFIKKDQLKELQEEFNLSSIEGNKRVYVIWNCEKMNSQASNSILKFLEEPVDGIIAILVTNNINNLMSTIISRCQCIKLNKFSNNSISISNLKLVVDEEKIFDDEEFNSNVNLVLKFIDYYEENGNDIFIYMKKMWHDLFKNRNIYKVNFLIMLFFYKEALSYKLTGNIKYFDEYSGSIKKIINKLEFNQLIDTINLIDKYVNYIKFNLNLNMLMDSFIIEMGEIR